MKRIAAVLAGAVVSTWLAWAALVVADRQAGDEWERAIVPSEEVNRKIFRPTMRELAVRVYELEQRVQALEGKSCQ
jgi:hypothetical protein